MVWVSIFNLFIKHCYDILHSGQTIPDAKNRDGVEAALNRVESLEVEDVANLAIHVLKNGECGSAWVILNKKIPPYEMQNEMTRENLRKNAKIQ